MSADAGAILDDVVSLIGADVARTRDLLAAKERVLTGEEARILAGYARALVDVARARKAADEDPITTEEEQALDLIEKNIEKIPGAAEALRRARGGK